MDVRMFVNSNVRNAYIWELGDTLAELTAKIKTLKNILDFICPF